MQSIEVEMNSKRALHRFENKQNTAENKLLFKCIGG